jgi:pimeloyl-ACP methyl ester carboxylesterase
MRQTMTETPRPLSGETIGFDAPGTGRLCAFVAGQGRPLLLVHSVNAAASVAEVRPLHEHFSATRTVFSLDLPGFGRSERSDRAYTPRLMTDALHAALAQIRSRCGEQPVDALAVSTGCEFLARAATEAPGQLRRIVLVSPTGLAGGRERRGAPGSSLGMPWLLGTLRGPGWGGALFRGLTRPSVVRYFLRRTWGAQDIDEGLWRDSVANARVAGAEYAPLHFLAGNLFSADILDVYERIPQPVWAAHGVRGDFTDYRRLAPLAAARGWRVTTYPTGALPYFEVGDAFQRDCTAFLDET